MMLQRVKTKCPGCRRDKDPEAHDFEACLEKRRANGRAYYEANRDKARAYYEATRDKRRTQRRAYYEANRDKARAYYEANLEKKREYNANYHAANRESLRARALVYNEANREKRLAYLEANRERRLFNSSRQRARDLDIPHSITVEDIVIPNACPCCGTTIVRGRGSVQPASPSLDRIIPSFGYVPGNVMVICNACNSAKNSMTLAQGRWFVATMEKADRELRERGAQEVALQPGATMAIKKARRQRAQERRTRANASAPVSDSGQT